MRCVGGVEEGGIGFNLDKDRRRKEKNRQLIASTALKRWVAFLLFCWFIFAFSHFLISHFSTYEEWRSRS